MLKTDLEGLVIMLAAKSEREARDYARTMRAREKDRRYRARMKQCSAIGKRAKV